MKARFLFALLAPLVFGCSSSDDHSGKTVFRYNEPGGITSIDPAYCRNTENIWPVNMVFNTLVQFDKDLNIQPCIAKDWEVSNDGLEYSFALRSDVFFHDDACFSGGVGRKLTAHDVEYSFKRILDPKTASPGTWIFDPVSKDSISNKAAFIVENDSTFTVRLKEPFPAFLGIMAMQYSSIVPKEAIQRYGTDFGRHPVGTGPFKFFIWEEGVKLIFHKNPKYFESDSAGTRLPYLDAVSISFLKDKNANFLSMLKGDFDFLSGLDASYKDELLSASGELNSKYNQRFFLQKTGFLKSDYLGFNLDSTNAEFRNHPIHNKDIRKALNLAIDREDLIRFLRNNIGISAAPGFVPTSLIKERPLGENYAYNLTEANRLLSINGYPNGKGIPELVITTTAPGTELCEYIQSQWQKLGLKIKVEVLPEANHREGVANGNYLIFRKNWVADYPDAQNFFSVFYGKNWAPNGPNYTHFYDEDFDKLYASSLNLADESGRNENYLLMDKLLRGESPVVPLFYDEVIRLISKRVKGLESNSLNLLDLKKVRIKN